MFGGHSSKLRQTSEPEAPGSGRLLSDVEVGGVAKLLDVVSGQELKARLASMGLFPGVEFRVMKNDASGPFIVEVKGSRVILGRGMVHRIHVA